MLPTTGAVEKAVAGIEMAVAPTVPPAATIWAVVRVEGTGAVAPPLFAKVTLVTSGATERKVVPAMVIGAP